MFRFKTMLIVPTIVGIAMVLAQTAPAWARRPEMALVCHVDQETGERTLISVHPRALDAHSAHGDTFPLSPEECESDKVLVCHHAGPAQMFTLLIDADDLEEHLLEHGDTEGPCSNNNGTPAE